MKLAEVIAELGASDADLCVVVKRPWLPESEALLVPFTEDYAVPASATDSGYEYFMGVSTLLEEVLRDIGPNQTDDRRLQAVIYYAENDAYPEWLHPRREHEAGSGSAA